MGSLWYLNRRFKVKCTARHRPSFLRKDYAYLFERGKWFDENRRSGRSTAYSMLTTYSPSANGPQNQNKKTKAMQGLRPTKPPTKIKHKQGQTQLDLFN